MAVPVLHIGIRVQIRAGVRKQMLIQQLRSNPLFSSSLAQSQKNLFVVASDHTFELQNLKGELPQLVEETLAPASLARTNSSNDVRMGSAGPQH